MIKIALVGLGKMGLSHQAIVNSHPDAELVAVCDSAKYLLALMSKYARVKCYSDYKHMLNSEKLDAVFIATPSHFHGDMVRMALDKNLHVFCEKPFCLDFLIGGELANMAESKKLVNQVGYHNRFIASFEETKRLLENDVLGQIHNVQIESYGPVVLKSKSATWRTRQSEGGGCLYDYASHGIDLLNYLCGRPDHVGGTALNKIFSPDVEDEVHSTFFYKSGLTAQLSANWSDESYRKMSNRVSIWGKNGKIITDRQEMQIFLRSAPKNVTELKPGWNTVYTTDLTKDVWFYLRGEEYSAQVDHFIESIKIGRTETRSSFRSACETDRISGMMMQDARRDFKAHIQDEAPAKRAGAGWRSSFREFYTTFRQLGS